MMRDEFLSEEDLDLKNLKRGRVLRLLERLAGAVKATKLMTPTPISYSHGVFEREPEARDTDGCCGEQSK